VNIRTDSVAGRCGASPGDRASLFSWCRDYHPGMTRMFVGVVPGMTPLVTRQLDGVEGIRVTDTGFDGRSDLLLLDVGRGRRDSVWSLRTIEDVFVEIGRTTLSPSDRPRTVAERLWRADEVERALSVWSAAVRPLSRAMTYRVVARVLQERMFLRTDLRRAMTDVIASSRPKWRVADRAQVEIWVSEYQAGKVISGLRLSDATMRQHDGRLAERSGALRPTVAAMMVSLAGPHAGTLLDPCCGAGTILREATASGWTEVRGGDIDREAVATARRNAPSARVEQWDVRHMDLADASVSAVVSNLPFGRQFEVPGSMRDWLADALSEMARVTRGGGRLVLLAPSIPAGAAPAAIRQLSRDAIRLLGTRTALWVYER
jgi:23S rRNA G2445 N2-methylase RlmL